MRIGLSVEMLYPHASAAHEFPVLGPEIYSTKVYIQGGLPVYSETQSKSDELLTANFMEDFFTELMDLDLSNPVELPRMFGGHTYSETSSPDQDSRRILNTN